VWGWIELTKSFQSGVKLIRIKRFVPSKLEQQWYLAVQGKYQKHAVDSTKPRTVVMMLKHQ